MRPDILTSSIKLNELNWHSKKNMIFKLARRAKPNFMLYRDTPKIKWFTKTEFKGMCKDITSK